MSRLKTPDNQYTELTNKKMNNWHRTQSRNGTCSQNQTSTNHDIRMQPKSVTGDKKTVILSVWRSPQSVWKSDGVVSPAGFREHRGLGATRGDKRDNEVFRRNSIPSSLGGASVGLTWKGYQNMREHSLRQNLHRTSMAC